MEVIAKIKLGYRFLDHPVHVNIVYSGSFCMHAHNYMYKIRQKYYFSKFIEILITEATF